MENILFKTIDFFVDNSSLDVNFNAELSSPSNSLEIKLETVSEDDKKHLREDYDEAFLYNKHRGKMTGVKQFISKGRAEENEQTISVSKLKAMSHYRIVI